MRRKDREMDKEFGFEIIDKAQYGILSMLAEGNRPYGIPLSLVREENVLYFHSAKEGRKVEALAKDNRVSVAFVGEVKVPELYTNQELDEVVKNEAGAALLISKVFTVEFQSAIVTGRVKLVEAEAEKVKSMKLICEKYTPTKMAYFDLAIRAGLSKTNVYRVEIEEVTAKRKKYGDDGKEIKN